MRTVSIAEALTYGNNETIPAIEGKVVWSQDADKIHKGSGDFGEFTYQDVLLVVPESQKGDADSSITVVLKNKMTAEAREKGHYLDGNDLVGKLVRFESYESQRGLGGVKKLVQKKDDTEYHKIGFSGNVVVLDENGAGTPSAVQATQSTNPTEKSPSAGAQQPSSGSQVKHNPQMVGMCVKCACDARTASGQPFNADEIELEAKQLMKVCYALQSCEL